MNLEHALQEFRAGFSPFPASVMDIIRDAVGVHVDREFVVKRD
jgi:hypothetical protein